MYSITVLCIGFLDGDGKSTGTNIDDQPMYNTVMYIYIKWFVTMVNKYCTKIIEVQVTSGGQRRLLKKKLQVCESQKSCLFVGDQILILQINSLKILQCDFLDFFSHFVCHS